MAFERDHFLAQQRKRAALEQAERLEREQSMHDIRPRQARAAAAATTADDLPADPIENKWIAYSLTFLAYAIPLGFLAYVLYWNYLPFGYEKTFTIDVGSSSDTSGEFRLLPSRDLSERKTAPDGTTYRELNGIASVVFEPKAVLKNAQLTLSVESDPAGSVQIIPPHIDFDPSTVQWDYDWDFTKGDILGTSSRKVVTYQIASTTATTTPSGIATATTLISTTTVSELRGNAYPFDGCLYFDGTSRVELTNSADQFESGPFSVYVEWKPDQLVDGAQQILGHFNWELWQQIDSIRFQVGRLNDASGEILAISYPIENLESWISQKHTALLTYSPSDQPNRQKGNIELFIDGKFAGIKPILSGSIWNDYGGNQNLTLGKTSHNSGRYPGFRGCIYAAMLTHYSYNTGVDSLQITNLERAGNVNAYGFTSALRAIKLHAVQE